MEPCSGLQGVDTCPLGSTLFSPIEYGTATLVDRCLPVSPIPAPCVQQLSCFLEEPGVKGTHVSALKIALTAVGSRLLVTRMAPVLGLGQVSPGHCAPHGSGQVLIRAGSGDYLVDERAGKRFRNLSVPEMGLLGCPLPEVSSFP